MELIRPGHTPPAGPTPPCAIALGFFDGVHIGHAALLEETVAYANAHGILPAVLTFDADDSVYKSSSPRLTGTDERLRLFASYGIAYVFLCNFEEMRNDTPEFFVNRTLRNTCRAEAALCGFNFRFGAGAAGDADTLTRLMRAAGGDAVVLPPTTLADGTTVSSSAIRTAIERGDMPYAEEMLGRPYALTGEVLHGKALGRTLSFPTINQAFPPRAVIPAYGVYAVVCGIDGHPHLGVANVGVRPTVSGTLPNCETHLIDFDGDLYGKIVHTSFLQMLREERRFDTLSALKEQISHDKREVELTYGNRMDKTDGARRPR